MKDIVVVGGGVYIEFIFKSEVSMLVFFFDLMKILCIFDSNSIYIFYYCILRDNFVKD